MKSKALMLVVFGSIMLLSLAACSPGADPAQGGEAATLPAESEAEATEPQGYSAAEEEEAPASQAASSEVSITATDACALVTEEQVETAFGKDVTEVNANTQTIGTGCEYVFDGDSETELQVSFYEGEQAKHYLAGLVAASQESCDAFYETLFDLDFNDNPDRGQDVSSLSMSDVYRQYLDIFNNCPAYIHTEERTDVGANVLAAELIVFNWSSSVAVLGEDRVVEFTFQEPISEEANAAFEPAEDRESFYAAAQPYVDSVLAGYTEALVGLVQAAAE